MVNNRCNPFLDAPLTVRRVVLMAIAAVVFILGVIYGTVRGAFWTWCGRTRERRLDDFHRIMHKVFKLDLRLHPWLFCDIHNPYNETFERGSIAICNHQSLIDPLCLLILSPKLLIVTGKRVCQAGIAFGGVHLYQLYDGRNDRILQVSYRPWLYNRFFPGRRAFAEWAHLAFPFRSIPYCQNIAGRYPSFVHSWDRPCTAYA